MFERPFHSTQQATVDDVAKALTFLNLQAESSGDTTRVVNLMPMGKEIHFHIGIERQGRFVSYTTANAEGRIYEVEPGKTVIEGHAGMSGWMFLLLVSSVIGLFIYMLGLSSKDPKYPTVPFALFLLGVGVVGFLFLYYEQMKTIRGVQAAMGLVPRIVQQRALDGAQREQVRAAFQADPTGEAARANPHLKKW